MVFCKKCGKKLLDDDKFCDRCGTMVGEAAMPVQEPTPEPSQQQIPEPPQHVYVSEPVQTVAPKKQLSKMKYMYTSGGAVSWTAFVILLLVVAMIGYCMYATLYGPVYEIPAVSAVNALSDGELDTAFDVMDKATKYIYGPDEEFSIMVLGDIAYRLSTDDYLITDVNQGSMTISDSDRQGFQSFNEVMNIVIPVLVGVFAFCMLLTFLAAIFRNTVLTVFGMIFSLFICIPLSSVVIGLAVFGLHIAGIVLNTIANNKFRRARNLHAVS